MMSGMKSFFMLSVLALSACTARESAAPTAAAPAAGSLAVGNTQTYEVACASCVYGMPGVQGCKLAAKIDGKPVLVTGVPAPGHDSGICEHAVHADMTGKMEGDHFLAASCVLKP